MPFPATGDSRYQNSICPKFPLRFPLKLPALRGAPYPATDSRHCRPACPLGRSAKSALWTLDSTGIGASASGRPREPKYRSRCALASRMTATLVDNQYSTSRSSQGCYKVPHARPIDIATYSMQTTHWRERHAAKKRRKLQGSTPRHQTDIEERRQTPPSPRHNRPER
jgi:hypothetical protein